MSAFDLTATVINFALGGALFFLAVTVLRDSFSSRLNRVSGALFLFAGLAPIFWALGSLIKQYPSSTSPFEESTLFNLRFIWELYFPISIIFALRFNSAAQGRDIRRYLKYLLFLPQVLHLAAAVIFQNSDALMAWLVVDDASGPLGGFLEELFFKLQLLIMYVNLMLTKQEQFFPAINAAYGITAVVIVLRGAAQRFNLTFRRQGQLITAALAAPTALYLGVFVSDGLFEIGFSEKTQALTIMGAALALTATFFWAVIRYQFLNIGLAVRQSVVYTISSGMLVGLYLAIINFADTRIEALTSGEGIVLYVGFVTLALVFFQPLNSQIEEVIRKMFLRSRADFRNLIEEFSRRIISVFEPDQLRDIIEDNLKDYLMVDAVYFAIYDDRVQEYALLPSVTHPIKHIIDRHDRYLAGVGILDKPTPVEEMAPFVADSRLAEEIETRNTRLILPLRDADRLLGFMALSGKVSGANYSAEELNFLQVLSNQLVGALTNARLYAETVEKKRLEEEVAMARQIQLGLLPRSLPCTDHFSLAAHSTPSRTVGGDFYDVVEFPDGRYAVVIADASGKGMPAAMVITQIQAMLRSELNNNVDIRQALANVNNYLVTLTSSEKYATLCLGVFDSKTHSFEYVNAGHNYPALVRGSGECELLTTGGMIVGAFPNAVYESATVRLQPQDFIFFFTDGISETMNEEEEEYGEERLVEFLKTVRGASPEDIISETLAEVDRFYKEDPAHDDRTIVVLKALKEANGIG